MKRITVWFIFALIALTALTGFTGDVSDALPVDFTRPDRPFMLVSPEELTAAKAKIRSQRWAADSLKALRARADEIVANPQFFPESEGGWSHKYVSPKSAKTLQFDPKSPRRHLDSSTGEYLTGKQYDDAWNVLSVHFTAKQQEVLAAVWTLTQDKRYADMMRTVFLDIAKKYPTYRLHDKSMELLPADQPMGTNALTGGYAAAQSIDECNAFTSLAFSYDTLAGSGILSEAEQKQIEENVWKPLQAYMRRLKKLHPSGGNWWVWHSCGAVVVGVLMGDAELVDMGFNAPKCGLIPHMNAGYINEDGFTAELSPRYLAYPFEGLMRLAIAARRVGIDFYKEARFRKVFDLPLDIRQPNLYMPRLNDGGYSAITDPFFVSVYENAASWYDNPRYKQALVSIYSSTQPAVERDSIAALLYGPAELPQQGLGEAGSVFLKPSGLAILRAQGKDWNAVLKNDFGEGGHRHPDALNLVLFANGEEVFPGTASSFYGHSSYRQWFSQTIAHNTVTLNQNSQRIYSWGKTIEWGYSGAGLSVVQSMAGSQALQADPHLLTNTVPIQLRRTLIMLPSCIVDFTRSSTDYKADSPRGDFPETVQDMALHLNGVLTMDGQWTPWNEPLISNDRKIPNDRAPSQGYDLITDVQIAADPSHIYGRLVQKNGGGVDLWFSAAPEKGKVFTATGLGLPGAVDKRMPMIIQRRQANETVFAAVYAPWKDTAQVANVTFPAVKGSGAMAKIKHVDGVDIVLSLPESGELFVEGITLKGTLAARCEVKGGCKILLIGRSLRTGDVSLEMEAAGAILLESSGGVEKLSNLSETSVKGFITTTASGGRAGFELAASEKRVLSPQQPKLLKP
jgi:hypothetical protein